MTAQRFLEFSNGYHYSKAAREELAELLANMPENATVLDVGAGFGNNAISLLEAGHSVTATETNAECLGYLTSLTHKYDRLTVLSQAVEDSKSEDLFDAVVCTMVLHFLPKPAGENAIEQLQTCTAAGGLNFITIYLEGQPLTPEYSWTMSPGELMNRYYHGWEILRYYERKPNRLSRVRSLRQLLRWTAGKRGYTSARILARKP